MLYVGARMYANPDSVAAQSSRKDQDNGNAAMLRISLDTYHDRRTAYTFAVTAAGVRLDWYNSSDNEFRRDMTYDPVWQAKTRIDSLGWTAELAIPLSQLRFNAGQPVWGLNITRIIPNRNEHIYWSYIPRDENGWSSKFGALDGMDDLTPKRRVEFLPFVASEARVTSSELVADGNPFQGTREIQGRVGANLKMGFGPNLTLDATVLPDFGQVDADPAEVNLSAFETIFPERRPFFTEGNQLLRGRGSMPTYYNSRRIGSPPRGSVPGEFSDVPDVTTILGAAKLTGRLESGLSIGALGALTQREYGRFTTPTGDIDQREVEPMTAFGIVRLQQEFGADASTAGITLTGVNRNFDSFEMRSQLNERAVTGGGDFSLRFQGGKYEVRGHAGFSHIAGSSSAIVSAQTSSARYYQRPDQNYVTFDPNRTSLTGYSASLQASKNAGKHWLWGTGVWADSPGLELNDIGVIRRADDIQSWFFLNYRETEPGKVFRRYNIWMNPSVGFNFGGIRKNTALWTGGNVTWNNYMWNNFNMSYQPSTLNDALTRGGPLMGDVGGWRARLSWGNNRSANTNWSVGGGINDVNHNQSINAFASIGAQPSPQLQFSVGPSFFTQNNGRQYYTVRGEGSAATFGSTLHLLHHQVQPDLGAVPDQLSLHADTEPGALRRAVRSQRELLELRRTRGSAQQRPAYLRHRRDDHHAGGQLGNRADRFLRRDRRRIGFLACRTTTSTSHHSAAIWCCAGSGRPGAPCSSCGSRTSPGSRQTDRRWSRERCSTPSRRRARTSSPSRPTTGSR